MTVKTGSAWAGSFVTLDATGAVTAATGTPIGTLYVDGTADAASVTITGSNPYKWSVTLPSLTAGQRVDMYITATISTIATAGFVASEQADTVLDEVVVGSYTMRQLLKVMAAALAGKATGGGTTSVTFRGVDDASNVIVATVDTNGNRSAVTLTV